MHVYIGMPWMRWSVRFLAGVANDFEGLTRLHNCFGHMARMRCETTKLRHTAGAKMRCSTIELNMADDGTFNDSIKKSKSTTGVFQGTAY